jgi:hypothetical protein
MECRRESGTHYNNYRRSALELFEETFRRKNLGKNTLQWVDLHGLLLPEAIAVVERTIVAIKEEY